METERHHQACPILIVDGRPDNLMAMEAILRHPQYELTKAHSVREALTRLQEQEFAMVLLHAQMPGMDGPEVVTRIRHNPLSRLTPVIFVADDPLDKEWLYQGYEAGAVDHVMGSREPLILKSKVKIFAELYQARQDIHHHQDLSQKAEREERDSLLENALDAVVGMDYGGYVTYWNKEASRTFGWTRQEALGKKMSELIVPPESRKSHEDGLTGFLATGEGPILQKRIEVTSLRKNGERFPMELSVSPIRMGGKYSFYAFCRDIAAHKIIEKERKESLLQVEKSERQLKLIIDSTPAYVAFIDADERYQFVNLHYETLYGKDLVALKGRPVKDVMDPVTYKKSKPHYDRAIKGESTRLDLKIRRTDGYDIWLSVQYVPFIQNDQVRGLVLIATDITERKTDETDRKLQAELSYLHAKVTDEERLIKETTAKLARRLEVSRCYMAEASEDSTIATIHPGFSENLPPLQGTFDLNDFGPRMVEAWRSGSPASVCDVTKDPRTSKFSKGYTSIGVGSFLTVPLHRDGKLMAILSFTSEKKRQWQAREKELARTVAETLWSSLENNRLLKALKDAVQARDEFMSICSHELKTPVTSLKLQFQMVARQLGKGPDLGPSGNSVLKRIISANVQLDRIIKLIDDMLDVSRISLGKLSMEMTPLNLTSLVKEVLERFEDQFHSAHVTLNFDPRSKVYQVRGDEYRLEQVITNLLTNALKYGGGNPVSVEMGRKNRMVELKVTDHGMGIESQNLDRIFQRFERAVAASDISGLGMGLYISRQIMHSHQGDIKVLSEKGKGSTFIMEIPEVIPAHDSRHSAQI